MRLRVLLALLALTGLTVIAQRRPDQLPRFRSGASLVRVDAYIDKDGVALTDLSPGEFEVFEDDKPQTIESVEFITARPPGQQSARSEPATMADMREMAADPSARLFTLFLDSLHVSMTGSFRSQKPLLDALDRAIGQDDLVGVMTPEMSPANITYGRRTTGIESFLRDNWVWGERDKLNASDPREDEIRRCYPDSQSTAGIATEMIRRRREQRALGALAGLVAHLDGLRPDRKFVLVFSEGWPLYERSENLGRPLDGRVPGRDRIGTGPDGRISTGPEPAAGGQGTGYESCERERVMLAFIDHGIEFRELLQRANRANVTFYPVDARGLVVFDAPIGGPGRADLAVSADATSLRARQDTLRTMAVQTDGVAIVDAANVGAAMLRMLADIGSHYLISYYSTNTKLDGRFRRITVRLKREGAEVRARPGYLAPTEAEARAAGLVPSPVAGRAGTPAPPSTVTRALEAIAPGRGSLPARIQATGAPGLVRAVVELDAATLKLTEWLSGGDVRLTVEPERGGGAPATIEAALGPGQRSVVIQGPAVALAAGRYSVKAEVRPKSGRLPLQVTTYALVPPDTAAVGSAALALRRGPSTGLAYQPTADPRFRRTERLRTEIPRLVEGVTATARVLTRDGQPLALVPSLTERADEVAGLTFTVAEVALAPLAEGEYVFEITLAHGGTTDVVSYGFRLIP